MDIFKKQPNMFYMRGDDDSVNAVRHINTCISTACSSPGFVTIVTSADAQALLDSCPAPPSENEQDSSSGAHAHHRAALTECKRLLTVYPRVRWAHLRKILNIISTHGEDLSLLTDPDVLIPFGPEVDVNYMICLDFRVKTNETKASETQLDARTTDTAKTDAPETETQAKTAATNAVKDSAREIQARAGINKKRRRRTRRRVTTPASESASMRCSATSQIPAFASQASSVIDETVPSDTDPTMPSVIDPSTDWWFQKRRGRSTPY